MTKTKKKGNFNQLGVLIALVLLCVVLSVITEGRFIRMSNLMNVLDQTAFNAMLAIGMLLCLITAGIDLSVGANAVFCSCIGGMLVLRDVENPILIIAVIIVCGTLVGLINGLLLTRLHLPHPFVSTLGMKNFLWGMALLVTGSSMVSGFPDGVMWLGSKSFGGVKVSFILVIILYIIMHILLTRTSLGRSIFCVGGNPEAARLSGIHSNNVLTFCYTISGFCASLAGIITIGRTSICNGTDAVNPYDTDAIAACIIGGASFMGGKGTMLGTILGALIIGTLRNGFTLMAASSAIQNIVLGLVIIIAVFIDVTRERLEAKARRLAAK
nr:ABC transporter permease [uncultured Agathobaculum sp.]